MTERILLALTLLLFASGDQVQQSWMSYERLLTSLYAIDDTVLPSDTTFFEPGGCYSVYTRLATIDGEDIEIFDYANSPSAETAATQIAPDGYMVRTLTGACMIDYVAPPHFFKDRNLIVLYVGKNSHILEVLSNVLGSQFAGTQP